MTDVMIVVQSQEFKAHKAVLACHSPYFNDVLNKPGFNEIHYVNFHSYFISFYFVFKISDTKSLILFWLAKKERFRSISDIKIVALKTSSNYLEDGSNKIVISKEKECVHHGNITRFISYFS